MFDIGWSELLILAVVTILIVGPRDLPRMMRSVGKYAGKVRRTANEFRAQFDDAIRESELDDLRKQLDEVRDVNPIREIQDSLSDIDLAQVDSDTAPKIAKPKPSEGGDGAASDAHEGAATPSIEPPVAHGEAPAVAPVDTMPEDVPARTASGKSGG